MTVQTLPTPKPALAIGAPRGLQPTDMESAWRMAKAISASGFAPKAYGTGEQGTAAVFVAMQLGAEVGLSPMASVQNIAVINGKPGLYGPAMLALCEASGKVESHEETLEGAGDTRVAIVTTKRQGRQARSARFGVPDAKRAGLWGKSGPWTQYPDRMLLMRARTFLLRDVYPDVLLGLCYGAEELHDMGPEFARDVTPERSKSGAAAVEAALSAPVDEEQAPYNAETGEIEQASAGGPAPAGEAAATVEASNSPEARPTVAAEHSEAGAPEAIKPPMIAGGKTVDWPALSMAIQQAILEAPDNATLDAVWSANTPSLKQMQIKNPQAFAAAKNTASARKAELTTGGLTP